MQRNLGADSFDSEEEQFKSSEFRERLRRRDGDAWDHLYRFYASKLEAVARRILPARLDPEGAAQQAWVRGLIKAKQFARKRGSRENPYPWLCSICINGCISILRNDKVRSNPAVGYSLLGWAQSRRPLALFVREGETNRVVGTAAATGAGPGEGIEDPRLRRAMAALPRRLQQVIYLRFVCGFSMTAVAEVLRISEGAVRQRLSRAYRKLREELEEGDVE